MLALFKRKLITPKIRGEKSLTRLPHALVLVNKFEFAGISKVGTSCCWSRNEPWRRLVQNSGKVIASVLLLNSEFTAKHLVMSWGLLLVSKTTVKRADLQQERERTN